MEEREQTLLLDGSDIGGDNGSGTGTPTGGAGGDMDDEDMEDE